jgi:hypothetical protein
MRTQLIFWIDPELRSNSVWRQPVQEGFASATGPDLSVRPTWKKYPNLV